MYKVQNYDPHKYRLRNRNKETKRNLMQQIISVMGCDWVKVCEDGSQFDRKYLTVFEKKGICRRVCVSVLLSYCPIKRQILIEVEKI